MAAVAYPSPPNKLSSPAIGGKISQIIKQQHSADVEMLSNNPTYQVQVKSTQPEPKKNSEPTTDTEARSGEQTNGNIIENGTSSTEEEEEEHDNPNDPLPDFDWAEFQGRYLDAMGQANEDEQALRDQFSGLVEVFQHSSYPLEFN